MTRAFAEACQVENGFEDIPVPGRTDRVILADALAKWGVEGGSELVAAFQRVYYRCLAEELCHLSPTVPGVLPGVRPLLDALKSTASVTVALLTGNYAISARLKLERFDLWEYFPFGGAFGDDEQERERLVPVAVRRARAAGMPRVAPDDVIVIGDTPLDVACGAANGARTLAVATGSYDVTALEAAGAGKVVTDLSDTDVVMSWLTT